MLSEIKKKKMLLGNSWALEVFQNMTYLHHGGKLVSIRRNLPQKLEHTTTGHF